MKQKIQTQKSKDFLSSVNLNRIYQVINRINFNSRERIIIDYILDKKTIKEMSIELNLSLSYIASLKQEIYRKIYIYLELEKNNQL